MIWDCNGLYVITLEVLSLLHQKTWPTKSFGIFDTNQVPQEDFTNNLNRNHRVTVESPTNHREPATSSSGNRIPTADHESQIRCPHECAFCLGCVLSGSIHVYFFLFSEMSNLEFAHVSTFMFNSCYPHSTIGFPHSPATVPALTTPSASTVSAVGAGVGAGGAALVGPLASSRSSGPWNKAKNCGKMVDWTVRCVYR